MFARTTTLCSLTIYHCVTPYWSRHRCCLSKVRANCKNFTLQTNKCSGGASPDLTVGRGLKHLEGQDDIAGLVASPDLTVGRGLKRSCLILRSVRWRRIARPHGRARIETCWPQVHSTPVGRIARPHGRARIETRSPHARQARAHASPDLTVGRGLKRTRDGRTDCGGVASPDLTVGRGLKRRSRRSTHRPVPHRPTSRSGAD